MNDLYKSRTNKIISGVCGGIAERYNIDASIVRLVCLALCLFTGFGWLIYIAAIVIIPDDPTDRIDYDSDVESEIEFKDDIE